MKLRTTPLVPALTVSAVLALVVGAGVAVVLGGGTFAALSDSEPSTPSQAGAATVELGGDGAGPELGYRGLLPGVAQTVQLTVTYAGTVPAAIGLSFAPGAESGLCEERGGRWADRPGSALTLRIGDGPQESFCSLYDGRVLPLGTADPQTGRLTVPVTLTLGSPLATGLREVGVATVHADGGFTDRVDGRVTIDTAAAADVPAALAALGDPALVEPVLPGATPVVAELAAPGAAAPLDPTDPATAARDAAPGTGVALPAECAAAGMTPTGMAEVVAVDPAAPRFDATTRGRGAGPFLVLGTAAADTIVGSAEGDCIVGGGGDDRITGGGGADVFVGGAGADVLLGGDGADHLFGGPGRDELVGGAGTDVLDGGPDDATCDDVPAERALRCLPPVVGPAAPATTPAPPAPAAETLAPAPVDPAPVDPAPADPAPTTEPPPPVTTTAPAAESATPATASAPSDTPSDTGLPRAAGDETTSEQAGPTEAP